MAVSVDAPTQPTGFVTNLSNPGNIVARYVNTDGHNANQVRARMYNADGSVYQTGPYLTKTVAANSNISIGWVESLFGSLPQATELGIAVQARNSNTGLWTLFSGITYFRTNAAPNIPTSLQPATGYASSTRPRLTCQATDPDTWEDPPGSLTVYAEILDEDGVTVKYTRTMPWVSATGQYEYQITSTDEPLYRVFAWRAYAKDAGGLYSGGATSAAEASRSAAQTIVYAPAPTVTITGPASPVSTMNPALTWTTSNQASFSVTVTLPDGRVAYRATRADADARTFTVGVGGWLIPNGWRNGETATLTLEVTSAAGIKGAATRALLLQYTKPGAATGFNAVPITLPGTRGTNGVEVSWLTSSIPTNEFYDYLIQRVEITGSSGTGIPGTSVYVASITNRAQLEMRDYTVKSGQWYRYNIYQRRKVGEDVLWSDPVGFDAMAQWSGVVIHVMATPETYCVGLQYGAAGSSWEPNQTFGKRITMYNTLGKRKRVPRIARSSEIAASHTFGLINDPLTGVAADQQRDRILKIWDAQDEGPDGRPKTICWRDGRGGRESVLYGVFADPPEITQEGNFQNVYSASLTLQDVDVKLGVEP